MPFQVEDNTEQSLGRTEHDIKIAIENLLNCFCRV